MYLFQPFRHSAPASSNYPTASSPNRLTLPDHGHELERDISSARRFKYRLYPYLLLPHRDRAVCWPQLERYPLSRPTYSSRSSSVNLLLHLPDSIPASKPAKPTTLESCSSTLVSFYFKCPTLRSFRLREVQGYG